ncbi:MAG: ABC-2 family transporter protein, partial [Candidatus Melainabacteria bacterium]|nr:ABC-2 family transporter protein [Candidatus Melainabacteria bacterium]
MGAAKLGGLTLTQMLWYLCVTESITLSAPRIAQVVDEDVRTGTLAVQLTRPLLYPLYCLSTTSGERLVRFALNLSVGAIITFVLIGPMEVSALGLMIFAVSLPTAFVLDFLANFLIGLGAFWLEDTSGLMLVYSRLTMILGGMLIPLELFPEAIQPVLKA